MATKKSTVNAAAASCPYELLDNAEALNRVRAADEASRQIYVLLEDVLEKMPPSEEDWVATRAVVRRAMNLAGSAMSLLVGADDPGEVSDALQEVANG